MICGRYCVLSLINGTGGHPDAGCFVWLGHPSCGWLARVRDHSRVRRCAVPADRPPVAPPRLRRPPSPSTRSGTPAASRGGVCWRARPAHRPARPAAARATPAHTSTPAGEHGAAADAAGGRSDRRPESVWTAGGVTGAAGAELSRRIDSEDTDGDWPGLGRCPADCGWEPGPVCLRRGRRARTCARAAHVAP